MGKGKKLAYIIFKIEEHEIKVVHEVKLSNYGEDEKSCNWSDLHTDFKKEMLEQDPCYGVVDYEQKVVFYSFTGSKAKAADRMTYASCRNNFKNQLQGVHIDIQANDEDDLSVDTLKQKMK